MGIWLFWYSDVMLFLHLVKPRRQRIHTSTFQQQQPYWSKYDNTSSISHFPNRRREKSHSLHLPLITVTTLVRNTLFAHFTTYKVTVQAIAKADYLSLHQIHHINQRALQYCSNLTPSYYPIYNPQPCQELWWIRSHRHRRVVVG